MNQNLPDILLIDNTPRRGGEIHPRIRLLEEILRSYPAAVRTVHYRDVGPACVEGATAIVLSGSAHNMSEQATKEAMRPVVELVSNTGLPVLGICFGFHLLLHAYGCEVKRNEGNVPKVVGCCRERPTPAALGGR